MRYRLAVEKICICAESCDLDEGKYGILGSDVVPFTQARANLSELADQAKAGAEKIITKNGESTSP